MAKFNKYNTDSFNEAAKMSNETAVVTTVKRIKNENLFDYIGNMEDTADTADLEESIKQLGFIDPIEVTDYGMAEGQYTILSGHRRRSAGVKQGINIFPCLVWKFKSESEIKNYVLFANSHRDSSKDPLLIAKRYREHKKYLESQGQTTNFREEIAKRLGLSAKQADRYNRLLDIIPEVWGLIRKNIVGMSSIIKMASYNEEEQNGIFDMLMDCYNDGLQLSRIRCEKIISAYDKGLRTYDEIKKNWIDKPDNASEDETDNEIIISNEIDDIDDEQRGTSFQSTAGNNSDDDKSDKEEVINDGKINTSVNKFSNNSVNEGRESDANIYGKKDNIDITDNVKEYGNGGEEIKGSKPIIFDSEQKNQRGLNIIKNIETLEASLNEIYTFNNEETAAHAVQTIKNMIKIMLEEAERISKKYNNDDLFNNSIEELSAELKKYNTKHKK